MSEGTYVFPPSRFHACLAPMIYQAMGERAPQPEGETVAAITEWLGTPMKYKPNGDLLTGYKGPRVDGVRTIADLAEDYLWEREHEQAGA